MKKVYYVLDIMRKKYSFIDFLDPNSFRRVVLSPPHSERAES